MKRGKRIKKIVRVARATLPEIFDLKDVLVKACLDGAIDEGELADLEKRWHDLWRSIGQARREEIEE